MKHFFPFLLMLLGVSCSLHSGCSGARTPPKLKLPTAIDETQRILHIGSPISLIVIDLEAVTIHGWRITIEKGRFPRYTLAKPVPIRGSDADKLQDLLLRLKERDPSGEAFFAENEEARREGYEYGPPRVCTAKWEIDPNRYDCKQISFPSLRDVKDVEQLFMGFHPVRDYVYYADGFRVEDDQPSRRVTENLLARMERSEAESEVKFQWHHDRINRFITIKAGPQGNFQISGQVNFNVGDVHHWLHIDEPKLVGEPMNGALRDALSRITITARSKSECEGGEGPRVRSLRGSYPEYQLSFPKSDGRHYHSSKDGIDWCNVISSTDVFPAVETTFRYSQPKEDLMGGKPVAR